MVYKTGVIISCFKKLGHFSRHDGNDLCILPVSICFKERGINRDSSWHFKKMISHLFRLDLQDLIQDPGDHDFLGLPESLGRGSGRLSHAVRDDCDDHEDVSESEDNPDDQTDLVDDLPVAQTCQDLGIPSCKKNKNEKRSMK